ncbi:hypothetical protein AM501_02965 [Aneurinibacillus migulanus]|uniref:hypothetical protein n=1 Tax=Aneurinibacillus migulanus TaxID=47500 RepID=UPI0005B9ACC2|nr:hypothetical protein [Aneurinibacillus migulanus]KIV50858.1 hypothetical protein TS64_25100 [Aneurinibacillus migulanus]KPD09601.1 hypothetical protein AM501_02965 [Aneurinibacillus migulanus]MCP1358588.1 hypothetical protein [Aneurinibacillus migulanus]
MITKTLNLSNVSTSELHAELVKRWAVKEIVFSPEQSLSMTQWEKSCRFEPLPTVQGPAWILINEDQPLRGVFFCLSS